MKYFAIAAAVAATLNFSGCGVAYHAKRSQILKTASPTDFGPPPPANHQSIEMAVIRERLKDPDSAKFQFGEKFAKEAIQPAFASPEAVPVWMSGGKVNAKNSYGGYTGFQPWLIAWRNGRPFAVMQLTETEYGVQDGNWTYLR